MDSKPAERKKQPKLVEKSVQPKQGEKNKKIKFYLQDANTAIPCL